MITALRDLSNKTIIYIEDVEEILREKGNMDRSEVSEICTEILNGNNSFFTDKITRKLYKKNQLLKDCDDILKEITLKLNKGSICSQKITQGIENNLINMLNDITKDTCGKIIYKTQLDVILTTIGRIFLWEKYNEKDILSKENLEIYLIKNMSDYSEIYPKLTNELLDSISTENLSSEWLTYISNNEIDNIIFAHFSSNLQ